MNTPSPAVHLVVVGGVHDGRVIPVVPPFVIGRAAECHLRPASAAVSQRHCVIELREGRAFIQDLGSTNGTFLNDDRLISDCPLRDGDELCVGPLRFLVSSDSPIRLVEELIPASPPASASGNETIVNGELKAADETVVSDDHMTYDEAARLLLEDDEEAETPTHEVAVIEQAPPSDTTMSTVASNILRQMRRTKK